MRRALLAFPFALALACSSTPPEAPSTGPLDAALRASAAEAGVPRDLLVAIASVEGGLDMPAVREVAPEHEVPAAGPLMLRRGRLDTLARGAALSGDTELALRRDTDRALRAGALVLAELGRKTGARADDLASWQAAIEEMSGYADPAHREAYAHRVFATLARGGELEGRDGERIHLAPHEELPFALTVDLSDALRTLGTPDFPGAEWIPTSCTNKCQTNRGGAPIDYVIIHDTEGGWDASVATLQNDPNKSVHYIIGTDGRLAQFIPESYLSWNCGNSFYNARSISIEHVGYATKPFTEKQYAKSAQLVASIAARHGVPIDRKHVIGHDQVPDGGVIAASSPPCPDSPKACTAGGKYGGASNHSDPGVWEWATYMPRMGGSAKCTDVTPILNCGWDGKRAFRCVDGKVEVRTCNGPGGCKVMASGVDDQCDALPEEPPPTQTPGAPPPAQMGAPPPSTPAVPPATAEAKQGGGCSMGGAASGSAAWIAGLGAVFARGRRRRPRA
jgi:N-acetyl-anhydromuramyl-L-alanine amidase AmpD